MTDDTIAMKTILVKTAILDNNVTSIALLLASDNELCGENTQNNKMHYNTVLLPRMRVKPCSCNYTNSFGFNTIFPHCIVIF